MENQTEVTDWRQEITGTNYETLKINDGENIPFFFEDEGKLIKHPDFDPAIRFTVTPIMNNPDKKLFSWYVSHKNYDLLGQIKELGVLKGKQVEVTRTGSTRSNTRYAIKELITSTEGISVQT